MLHKYKRFLGSILRLRGLTLKSSELNLRRLGKGKHTSFKESELDVFGPCKKGNPLPERFFSTHPNKWVFASVIALGNQERELSLCGTGRKSVALRVSLWDQAHWSTLCWCPTVPGWQASDRPH